MTLSIAVAISLLVSLTTTPMLCARLSASEESEPGESPERIEADGLAAPFCAERAGVRTNARRLRPHARMGAGAYGHDSRRPVADDPRQCLPGGRRPEGILPAAGQRLDDGDHPSLASRVVSIDAPDSRRRRQHAPSGPGHRERRRGRRHRRHVKSSQAVHLPQAAHRA